LVCDCIAAGLVAMSRRGSRTSPPLQRARLGFFALPVANSLMTKPAAQPELCDVSGGAMRLASTLPTLDRFPPLQILSAAWVTSSRPMHLEGNVFDLLQLSGGARSRRAGAPALIGCLLQLAYQYSTRSMMFSRSQCKPALPPSLNVEPSPRMRIPSDSKMAPRRFCISLGPSVVLRELT
jgi:hypothetical protein